MHGNNLLASSPFMMSKARVVASMRQDEAVVGIFFFFEKKNLIEKIIPRKNWVG